MLWFIRLWRSHIGLGLGLDFGLRLGVGQGFGLGYCFTFTWLFRQSGLQAYKLTAAVTYILKPGGLLVILCHLANVAEYLYSL